MESSPTVQPQVIRKPVRRQELGAVLLFIAVGSVLAMPCLCLEGAIAGLYKSILFLLVALRMAWSIYRGRFRFRDYGFYVTIVITFCLWADAQY